MRKEYIRSIHKQCIKLRLILFRRAFGGEGIRLFCGERSIFKRWTTGLPLLDSVIT